MKVKDDVDLSQKWILIWEHGQDVLQRRDESQIDFEELSVYLQRTLAEREKHPEKSAELDPKIREVS